MAKHEHRGILYAVIRHATKQPYSRDVVIGVYSTLRRAEEIAGASTQSLLDAGCSPNEFKCVVQPTTYYSE